MIKITARFVGNDSCNFVKYDIYKLNFWTTEGKVIICENVTLKFNTEYGSYSEFRLQWKITKIDTAENSANSMTALDAAYWKKRCEAAENYLDKLGQGEEATNDQISAHNEWQLIKGQL